MGGRAMLEALVGCLTFSPSSTGSSTAFAGTSRHRQPGINADCTLVRTAMVTVALLREQGQAACLRFLVQEAGNTENGGSLPVRLLLLAEAAVADQGPDAPVTPVLTAAWPEGSWPEVRDAQVAWQHRLRVAQEALTLLRALLLDELTVSAVAVELLGSGRAVAREVLAATVRLSRVSGAVVEGAAVQYLLPGLPLAAWARAIGSSSVAHSVSSSDGGSERGGLPCCSSRDVAYLAQRLRERLLAHKSILLL